MTQAEAKDFIIKTIIHGTKEEKLLLYGFDSNTPKERVYKKFRYFARANYPRYFQERSAPFQELFAKDMVASYYGVNKVQAAFRGSAKTSLKKLFDVFVLLNDRDGYRKYIKVLSRDGKNSKQIVTDVYNLIVEVQDLYGNVFEKSDNVKREETMSGFTMRNGRKYAAGTVGQTQRGHIQDAYRPDWIWFEDIEDRESIGSAVMTQGTINRVDEAIGGLSIKGSYYVTCNYISDQGVVQWFMNRSSVSTRITPLLLDADDPKSVTWKAISEEKVKEFKKDAEDFFGEFQQDPKRSENKFFDVARIERDLKLCKEPKTISGDVKYWGSYQSNHRYGAGSDHSEGTGRDANTLALFDFNTGELMASYANNEIAPDMSVHEFARVCSEFGNCMYAPETNNRCGGIAITTLKNLPVPYPNIFRQTTEDKATKKLTEKLGWETNSKTKYTMFYEFKTDYNDGLIKIYDKDVLAEMKAYTNSDLTEKTTGLKTRHFDLLIAVVIAWQMRKYVGAPKSNYRAAYQKYIDSGKK